MGRRGSVGVCAVLLLLSGGLMATPYATAQIAPGAPVELAFAHDGAVYGLGADGSGRRLIMGGQGTRGGLSYGEPAWSPDGSTLAFVRVADDPDGDRAQIMLMDASGLRALTPLRRNRYDSSPAWSPDGRRLVFGRFKSTGDDSLTTSIVVIGRDGSGARAITRRRLSRGFTTVGAPTWLPDGGVSYTQSSLDRRYYFRPSVYVIGADGSGRRLLLRDALSADWSPDGSRIAFSSVKDRNGSRCGSDECSYNAELYVARSDGREQKRLTRNGGDDAEPDWSPDGTRILFSSDRNYPSGQSPEVYSIGSDGRCLTWLTNGTPGSENPVWRQGSGTRVEPGACGAAGRRPLIEVRPSGALPNALWLGPSSRGLLLADFERGPRTFLVYDDCSRYRPAGCPRPIQVQNTSVCARHAFSSVLETDFVRLRRARGALLATSRDFEIGGFSLYTASTEVSVSLEVESRPRLEAEARAVLRGLRPIAGSGPRSAPLPPPRVPGTLARKLRRALASRRAHATARNAARALGVSPSTLRRRLRLARGLQSVGGIRAAGCPTGR